jgi:hypothetical protein
MRNSKPFKSTHNARDGVSMTVLTNPCYPYCNPFNSLRREKIFVATAATSV